MAKKIWLMKTEPDTFSIQDLQKRPKQTEPWNGVRGFPARNHMKSMSLGDEVLFYHSSCKPPGIVGLATISATAYPDATAVDPKSDYFHPKAAEPGKQNPWVVVDVTFKREFKNMITLDEIKTVPGLRNMIVLKEPRLSVQPVTPEEFAIILKLAGSKKA
jgi:predicted RNA-binding protein with PUA-like domain